MSTLLIIPKTPRSLTWINENIIRGRRLNNNGIEVDRIMVPEIIEAAEEDNIIDEIEIEE